MHDEDNDGRFPDESLVEVRYPHSKQEEHGDRERWPWLPGTSGCILHLFGLMRVVLLLSWWRR